jgi:tRNA dimethylallyltransferase
VDPVLIAVMGPTATGKTDLAESIAEEIDAQLINADAFQAYRGMDIGTAKPDHRERYRLLDIKDPNEGYGVGEFCARAQEILNELWAQRRSAVVVGGTGLYIRALFEQYEFLMPEPDQGLREELQRRLKDEGLDSLVAELKVRDPETHARIDHRNPLRVTRALEKSIDTRPPSRVVLPPFQRLKFGLLLNMTDLRARIEERTRLMVHNGWVQEVEALLSLGYGPGDPGFRAIGYGEIAAHLAGETDLEGAIATTIVETRRYAKRQSTWLRSEPKIRNLDPSVPDILEAVIRAIGRMSSVRG